MTPLPTLGAGPSALAASGTNDIYTYLESWWPLNEESGTRYDAHGSNDLTDNNTVLYSASGKQGNAADFEYDNSEYLSTPDNTSLSIGDIDCAWALWVKLESESTTLTAVGKWLPTGSQREYRILYYQPNDRFMWLTSGNGTTSSNVEADTLGAVSTGTWYFIVCYHDATANEIGISVNDGAFDTTAFSGGIHDGTAAFLLGGWYDGAPSEEWDGLIDEVAYWKGYIPTATEITALYNSGSGMSYSTFASTYG